MSEIIGALCGFISSFCYILQLSSCNITLKLLQTLMYCRLVLLKVVSIDRSLLQGVAPRFSADFVHHFSCERPFKFQRHLIEDFGCRKLIFNYCTYLWQWPLFNPIQIFPILLTHHLESYSNSSMNFLKSACHHFHNGRGAILQGQEGLNETNNEI